MPNTKRIIRTLVPFAALLFATSLFAAQPAKAPAKTPAVARATTPAPTPKAAPAPKKAAAVEQIDINRASKEELMKLPGIGDKLAEKIIAGRPYTSKYQLKTKKIISGAEYHKIVKMIIAKQAK